MNYKIFYKSNYSEDIREVAEFNTMKECKDYIDKQIMVDNDITLNNFYIYSLVG